MNCMIYQVYMGPQLKLYDHCVETVARYCAKYGITHIVQREPILRVRPDVSTTTRSTNSYERLGYLPIYEKENAFGYLDQFDRIAIIDADIHIREDAPNIFDELNDGTEFAGVVERDMPLTKQYFAKIRGYSNEQYSTLTDVDWKQNHNGYEFMNMGMMVFSSSLSKYLNGNTPKEFITRKEFKQFIDGIGHWRWSTDQTLLNYWIKKEKIKTKNLHWKWNALFMAIDESYLKEAHFIHFFLKDKLPDQGEHVKKLVKRLDIQ